MLMFSFMDKEIVQWIDIKLVLIIEYLCAMQYTVLHIIVSLIFITTLLCKYYHHPHFSGGRSGRLERLHNLPNVARVRGIRARNWGQGPIAWPVCYIHYLMQSGIMKELRVGLWMTLLHPWHIMWEENNN